MKKFGYTIAEILISLALIGIVVAVTLPTFVSNYRRQACASALSVAVSNFEKAMTAYIMKENATDLYNTTAWRNIRESHALLASLIPNRTLNGFVEDLEGLFALTYLSDTPNFNTFYTNDGIQIRDINGAVVENLNQLLLQTDGTGTITIPAGLRTFQAKNGVVYFIQFNSPAYGDDFAPLQEDFAANLGGALFNTFADIVIDVNGVQQPNMIGRDIFKFNLGHDGKLYPCGGLDYGIKERRTALTWRDARSNWTCMENDIKAFGWGCTARVIDENYRPQF